MILICFSRDAWFKVEELMLRDVCVGTTLPYFNCLLVGNKGL
jgi:hypothetical protein